MADRRGPGADVRPDASAAAGSGLAWLNALPDADATAVLRDCCDAPGWARKVAAGRPYRTVSELLAAAGRAWAAREPGELETAMAAHPRLGARGPGVPARSREEQSGIGADLRMLAELRAANIEYERRFGHVFLFCATGHKLAEILAELRTRMSSDPATERAVAASELAKITALRLRKLAGP